MPDQMVTQFVGIGAGCLTAVAMLPQVIKIFKEKKAEQVSLFMLFILIAGISMWIYYGVLQNDLPIMATNCFSLLVNILLFVLRIRYKN